MKNIAVFGGTFNPVHYGHIEIVKAVSKLDFIDELLIIPDKIPPHKNPDFLASDKHRIAMCRLAFLGINKAKIDTREIYRGGKSYTFDTLCELKKEYKNDNIFFVCGGDMVVSLHTWYKYSELVSLCEFIVFNRKGIENKQFFDAIENLKKSGAKITVIEETITDISSTSLRETILKNNNCSGFISEEIFNYIKENKVYG